jgi:RNA polymerase sigma-70 factor (ECF subfamily)
MGRPDTVASKDRAASGFVERGVPCPPDAPAPSVSVSMPGEQNSAFGDIELLVATHRRWLFAFVNSRIRDPELASDIVQDCFLKAYLAREQFRGGATIRTWLGSIALNLIRDHRRSPKGKFWQTTMNSHEHFDEQVTCLQLNAASPEESAIEGDCLSRVLRLLQTVRPDHRAVLLMRFEHEMSLSEIAIATGRPVSTIKTTIYRALHHLRRLYLREAEQQPIH